MKQLFYVLLAATVLFSSCSNDNDVISQEDCNSNNNTQKYTVNLNVKSAGFEVDKTPLKALTDESTFLQIIVYKEAGEAYSDTVITPESIKDIITDTGSFPFSLELPKGNYHLAFIQRWYNKNSYMQMTPEKAKLKPVNFYTDISGGGVIGNPVLYSSANDNDYYQTVDISVPAVSQDEVSDIVLEPMWSSVTVFIEDFTPPINCNFIRIDVLPAYTKFNISDKLAPNNLGTHYVGNRPEDNISRVYPGKNNGTVSKKWTLSKTSSENNNMKLVIKWYKDYNNNLIMTTETDLKTQLENGRNYIVRGKLSNIGEINGGEMSVTFAPFNDNPIDLPFNN